MRTARFLFGFVAVAMMATGSAYGLIEGGPDDQHLCYKAKPGKPKFIAVDNVAVHDAFDGATTAKVVKPAFTCNAATVGAGDPIDSLTHLTAYKIKSPIKHVPQLNLLIGDILGQLRVDTTKADLLLVPGNLGIGSPPTPPVFASHNVDNYKCYKVKVTKGTTFVAQQVAIEDEYSGTPKTFDIKKPKHLCIPSDVGSNLRKNNDGYLMCYQAKPARGQTKHVAQIGLRVGNAFNQLEPLDTKKEEEICFPAVRDPECGNDRIDQAIEECDGTSDSACPGQCSPNCGCWRPHTMTLDSAQSRIEVRGASTTTFDTGPEETFSFTGLAGSLTLNTGNRLSSGRYELSVPAVGLPPVDVEVIPMTLGVTACVFLQEDPSLPGSGIAGIGSVDCLGGGTNTEFPSPNLFIHQDHCTEGVGGCDSGTAFTSECTPDWGFDEVPLGPGKIHAATGACVPAALTDTMCNASDDLTGTTATVDTRPFPHPSGTCNSPLYGRLGNGAYEAGDAVMVVTAVVDLRELGDPCIDPPSVNAITVQGPITTGTATSTIMDAFPSKPGIGKVQSLVLNGSPLTCIAGPLPQHGDPIASTSGASFVIALSALDIDAAEPILLAFDLNAGIVLKAQ